MTVHQGRVGRQDSQGDLPLQWGSLTGPFLKSSSSGSQSMSQIKKPRDQCLLGHSICGVGAS